MILRREEPGDEPPASRWVLTCPFPVPDEAFLAVWLGTQMKAVSGRVVYPAKIAGV